MIVLALAFAISRSTFDFAEPPGPAKRVVAALAKATGQTLLTNGAAGALTVYVHGHNLTSRQVFDDLAKATGATWVVENEGLVFTLNIPQIESEDVRSRTEWLTREANNREKQYGEYRKMTPSEVDAAAEARRPSIANKSRVVPAEPADRAAHNILTPSFAPLLARLAPGSRTLFVESPNFLEQAPSRGRGLHASPGRP